MIGEIRIHYHGAFPGRSLPARDFNTMKRRVWETVGKKWHGDFRPKHFTPEGEKEYGYAPRSGETGKPAKNFWRSYMGFKQKKYHHQNPLMLTGELRDMAKVFRIETMATNTNSRLRVILPMANKANLKANQNSPDMRDELTRVSLAEAEESIKTFDRDLQSNLDAYQGVKTITVTGFFHGGD